MISVCNAFCTSGLNERLHGSYELVGVNNRAFRPVRNIEERNESTAVIAKPHRNERQNDFAMALWLGRVRIFYVLNLFCFIYKKASFFLFKPKSSSVFVTFLGVDCF